MTAEMLLAFGAFLVSLANAFAIVWGALTLKATAANIQKIELATNSMKDALVKKTEDEALLRGNVAGRAEMTAEQKVPR